MHKRILFLAAVSGAIAVALGAFGAHGLQKATSDEKILHGFQTAVQYQMYHTLALLACGLLLAQTAARAYRQAALLFGVGILLFSGSLYAFTYFDIQGIPVMKALRLLTPAGGVFFIAGWVMMAVAALHKRAE